MTMINIRHQLFRLEIIQMRKMITLFLASTALASCATAPGNVTAAYVSPAEYQGYSCDQVRVELARVGDQVREVTGQQAQKHTNDQVAMGVGLVLFWPALFFLMTPDH